MKNLNQDFIKSYRMLNVMNKSPYAMIILKHQDLTAVGFIDLIVEKLKDNFFKITGFISKDHCLVKHLVHNAKVTAVFQGPTAIDPDWYSLSDYPSWEYAGVQIDGLIAMEENNSDAINSNSPMAFKIIPQKMRGRFNLNPKVLI